MTSPAAPQADNPGTEKKLQELLQHIYTLHRTEIDLSLARMPRLLHKLGNPHLNLPPVIHVAGTNGKGSTCAILRALLETHGYRVHVATSPHLVRPHERIRLNGALISSEHLLAILEECLDVNGGQPITFFELFIAATFLVFSRVPADFCILETGLGGRLDATNVVPKPACTIITAISGDHREFLGDTLADIAAEKAGIMKPGVPCVIGYQPPAAIKAGVMDVFTNQSRVLSPPAPLVRGGSEWAADPIPDRFRFIYDSFESFLNHPVLCGLHQIQNAGAALAAFRVITGGMGDAEKLSTAMGQIDWPGRLQTLTNHPYNTLVPAGTDIIIDGGHNDSAGDVLAGQAQEWVRTDPKPLHLIVAMMKRKNPVEFLTPLIPYADSLTVTGIPGEQAAYTPDELFEKTKDLEFKTLYRMDSTSSAIENLNQASNSRILVTGSLYLMGHILK
jgi:dihydrofolate synthase/folylpolyglutamate synthase